MTDTLTDYGRELDFQGSGNVDCPPEDIYTFTVVDITDPQEKAGFNEGEVDIQVVLDCAIENYQYDPNDEEDFDWNGHTVKHFLVLGRRYPVKDKVTGERMKNADGAPLLTDPSPVWKSDHPNAKHRKVVEAIFPEWDWSKEGLRTRKIVLDDFIGRRFRATLAPNEKGYARLSNFTKAGRQKGSRPAAPTPPPVAEDEDEFFEDED